LDKKLCGLKAIMGMENNTQNFLKYLKNK
jgi:hypothetical protein